MNALWKAGVAWWQERESSERRWLQLAGLVIALALIFTIFVGPAYQGREHLLTALPGLRQQIATMDAQALEAHGLDAKGSIQTPSGEVLRDALAASLREHGFQSKPLAAGGNAVRIELHDVAFANWTAWLDEVREQLHVKVSEAHVLALKPGQVDLTATLSPP
jgi:general secretion pathway protein M